MKETLRETAPGSRETTSSTGTSATGLAAPIDGHFHPTPGYTSTAGTTTHTSGLTTGTTHVGTTGTTNLAGTEDGTQARHGLHEHTAPSASHTSGTASSLPAGHGTGHSDATQSVVDKLNANVQTAVQQTTGKKDLDVAEEQPKTSAGKRILEGLGLGGDERKTTLKGTAE